MYGEQWGGWQRQKLTPVTNFCLKFIPKFGQIGILYLFSTQYHLRIFQFSKIMFFFLIFYFFNFYIACSSKSVRNLWFQIFNRLENPDK